MIRHRLVTVITIFFNAERFIEEAIESVLGQTYPHWELLLVDDGSVDGSTAIALRYADQNPERVRYLQHHGHGNRGMSASRNLGIRHAKGEYIGFLDSDDVWLAHKLERQVAILEAEPEAGIVYGASQYWHTWATTGPTPGDYVLSLGVRPDALVKPPTLLTLLLQSKAPTPCPSDMLLRRETVRRVAGFEEAFGGIYQLFEDQAFLAKVYLQTAAFVSGECWDRYRQHADSCVATASRLGEKYRAGMFFFDWLENYLTGQGVTNIELWEALRGKRTRYREADLHWASTKGAERFQQCLKSFGLRTLPTSVYDWLRQCWRRGAGP